MRQKEFGRKHNPGGRNVRNKLGLGDRVGSGDAQKIGSASLRPGDGINIDRRCWEYKPENWKKI